MSPMKKGSGDLDFSQTPEDDEPEESETEAVETAPEPESAEPRSPPPKPEINEPDDHQYPYFVRRSKVMDEREERIEVHLRKSVANEESAFRSNLRDALEAGDVSKTDAREFALKYAFENPEAVAELMREEGYGLVD